MNLCSGPQLRAFVSLALLKAENFSIAKVHHPPTSYAMTHQILSTLPI